jgi:hypothetical protein
MGTAVVMACLVAGLVGLPLVVVLLAWAGPVGWLVAVTVLPILVLATLLWLGRDRD